MARTVKSIEKEVKKSIKKIKKKITVKKIDEKDRIKAATIKEKKKEKVEVREIAPDIHEIIREPEEDITDALKETGIGEKVEEEIRKDQEFPYPSEEKYQGEVQRREEEAYRRSEEKPDDFYKRPDMYEKGAYKKTESRHEIDEDINLHKKIKKYLRG